jgi:Flp pilus assembly protein TadG
MSIQTRSTKGRRGVAIMEFTFSLLFLIPLLIGVFVFGFKLIRSLEMTQIARDAGAMYLRGVDFRGAGAQQTAQTLAASFNMTATGTSVVILSKVKLITAADCTAANAVSPVVAGSACANLGKVVFVEQLTVGNPSKGSSAFGTPPVQPVTCTPLGPGTPCVYTVTVKDQGRTTSAQANAFAMVMKAGELAYVAEMVNLTPDFNVAGLSGPQIYARAIF